MRVLLILLWVFAATSVAGTLPDPYSGSGGAFLGTPSEQDIQSGRAIFGPEKCSSFTVGKTTKLEIIEKLGRPAGWSTERDGTSLLEYDYVEPAEMFGMQRVIATFFNFDRSLMLFKIKCPGFDQAIAPKDVATIEYKCDAPIPSLAADQTGPLKINSWFSKDHKNVYMSGDPIPGADPDSFRLACCSPCEVCGEDKNRCYWFEHPVPCDCKPHHGGQFAFPPPEREREQALLAAAGPISVDCAKLTPACHGLSVGYLRIDAGRHSVPLNCWNKNQSEQLQLTLDIEPARIYRLSQKKGTTCEIEVERTALVLGKIDGPEIRIGLTGNDEDRSRSTMPETTRTQLSTKPMSKVELTAGTHELIVVCRDVTRTGIEEKSTSITLQLAPGRIYQLNATFVPPEYKCDAQVTILDNS